MTQIEPQSIYNLERLSTVDIEAIQTINNATLENIEDGEKRIIADGLNQVEALNAGFMKDKFIHGMYARALLIPKHTFLTGKIHKRPYIDCVAYGDVSVKSFFEDGSYEDIDRIDSFTYFEGKEGRKRVLFTHQDTLWFTVDPTSSTSADGVPADVIFDTMTDYRNITDNKIISSNPNDDYNDLCLEFGVTDKFMLEKSRSEPVIHVDCKFDMRSSIIDGIGMFATRDVCKGELIGFGRVDGIKTTLGRYVNHAYNKNAVMSQVDFSITATSDIKENQELLFDYGDTMRQKEVIS